MHRHLFGEIAEHVQHGNQGVYRVAICSYGAIHLPKLSQLGEEVDQLLYWA